MSKETRLLKNTFIISIGNFCTKGISLLLLPLYTSLLSTSDYGTVDVITTYSSLLTVFLTLQMEQGLFRFLVEARGNKERQDAYISTVSIVAVSLLAVVTIVGKYFLEKHGYLFTDYLIGCVISSVIHAVALQIPRGLGENITYAAGSLISGAVTVTLNVVFIAYWGLGIRGMLLAGIIGPMCSTVFIIIKSKVYKYLKFSVFDFTALREIMLFSAPLIPYTICFWIINSVDRMIINASLGMESNGIYAVANKFPSIFTMLSNIFQTAWMASAFESVQDKDRNLYYGKIINAAVRFFSSGALLIIAGLPLLFDVLVDANYVEAYYYIPLLITAVMLHAVSSLYGAVYFALKKTKSIMWTVLLAASINLAVNLLLIETLELYAAAGSTLLAYLVIVLIRYSDIKKKMDITIERKYLAWEVVAYTVVLCGYYTKNMYIQMIVLLCVIPFVFVKNKGVLLSIMAKIKGGLGEKRNNL